MTPLSKKFFKAISILSDSVAMKLICTYILDHALKKA